MSYVVSPRLADTSSAEVLVDADAAALGHELSNRERAVFDAVRDGATGDEITRVLADDRVVGPLLAADVCASILRDLTSRGLVVRSNAVLSARGSLAARSEPRLYPSYDSVWLGRWRGACDLAEREDPAAHGNLLRLVQPLCTAESFRVRRVPSIVDV